MDLGYPLGSLLRVSLLIGGHTLRALQSGSSNNERFPGIYGFPQVLSTVFSQSSTGLSAHAGTSWLNVSSGKQSSGPTSRGNGMACWPNLREPLRLPETMDVNAEFTKPGKDPHAE